MSMQSNKVSSGPLVLLALIVVLIVALVASIVWLPAHASGGMRCRGKLITTGFHITQVKALCGDPDSVSTHYYHIYSGPEYHGNHQDIKVTEYVYNFGPNKFMRSLRFESGRLVRIDLLGYGYR